MIEPSKVHVWRSHLNQPPEQVAALATLLSVDEQQRAQRFRREVDQQHFIVARGGLRQILGHYLAIAPETVQFCYGDRGKPMLLDGSLQFNLSHSGGLALYAVAQRRVGIDIEQQRAITDVEQLAQRFFAVGEYKTLMALPPAERLGAFLQGWTAKEAYLKALGVGIGQLEQVEIGIGADSVELLRVPAPEQLGDWSLRMLPVEAGYWAALVGEGQGWEVVMGGWLHRFGNSGQDGGTDSKICGKIT